MIFGILAGIASALVGAVSSAISVVGSFCASVGKIAIEAISVVSNVVQAIGAALGIIPKDTNMEELGDKALQASEAGVKPENFDNYQDYINEVKNFKVDPLKSENWSKDEKLLAATGITVKGVEDKFDLKEGSMGDLITLVAMDKGEYFTPERITNYLQTGTDVQKIAQFFEGDLGIGDKRAIEKELVKAEQNLSPEKTDNQIKEELIDVQISLEKASKEQA